MIHKLLTFLVFFIVFETTAYAQKKRPEKAIVLLEEQYIEANTAKILNRKEEALKLFTEITEKNDSQHVAHFELARLYKREGNIEEAITALNIAVTIAPTTLKYRLLLLSLLKQNGQYNAVQEQYKIAIKLNIKNVGLYQEWTKFLLDQKKFKETLSVLSDWEDALGLDEKIYHYQSEVYVQQGKDKRLRKVLKRWISNYPTSIRALQKMALYFEGKGAIEDAMVVYRKILVLDPNNVRANVANAESYKQLGDENKYLEALQPLFDDESQKITSKVNVIRPLVVKFAQDPTLPIKDNLIKLLDIMYRRHPNSQETQLLMADVLYSAKSYKKAFVIYKELLVQHKNSIEIWERTLNLANKLGDFLVLETLSKECLELYPNHSTGYYFQGLSKLESGYLNEALKLLEEAKLYAFNQVERASDTWVALARVYHALSRFSEADKAFQEAIKLSGLNENALYYYSISLEQRLHNLDKAIKMTNQLLTINSRSCLYLTLAGRVLYRNKSYRLAERKFKKALLFGGETNSLTLEQYGDLLYKMNKPVEALKYWENALEIGGGSSLLPNKVDKKQLLE